MDKSHAPGFKSRKNADGESRYYWVAKADGYPLKTVRLHGDEETMAHRCRVLQSEMLQWQAEQGIEGRVLFDGTIKGLISVYRTTKESPYHTIKHSTRQMYDESLDLLEATVGARRLNVLTGLDFTRWYNNLKQPAEDGQPERVRRAYKAMQLTRIIVKFGVVANIAGCVRLAQILDVMEFKTPASRTEAITFQMVKDICAKAIESGNRSIAIAQAMQFELTLRQIDVIGEWEPAGNATSSIFDRGERWSGGVTWNHINKDWELRKDTTKTGQQAVHDVKAYPFLLSLLQSVPLEQRIGPIVINEATGLPWKRRDFAKKWRVYAKACGVPANVWNRDSRAGGVTEGSDAGADIEHLRQHANHADLRTTGRYNRKTIEKTRQVAHLRVANRDK